MKFLVQRRIEFYVVVPLQPWVQKKIQRLRDWQQVSRGIEVGEIPYVLAEGIPLRMVVIRKLVKGDEAPRKQLRLLGGEWATYDYQVIVTNGPLVAKRSGIFTISGPVVRILSKRGFMDWVWIRSSPILMGGITPILSC